jgi:hypothetical protein
MTDPTGDETPRAIPNLVPVDTSEPIWQDPARSEPFGAYGGDFAHITFAMQRSCPHFRHGVGRHVFGNGTTNYSPICLDCGDFVGPSKYIKKADAMRLVPVLEETPIFRDNRHPSPYDHMWSDHTPPTCERCGHPEVELHHWAPRALFDDADKWPTAHLCRTCHRRWHVVTGTHVARRSA